MKVTRKWLVLAGVGLAVVLLAAVVWPVAAASGVAAPARHAGGLPGGGSDAYLAQALGITEVELAAARQAAYEAGVDQALAEGLITQAQADALKERGGMFGRWGGRLLHGFLLGPAGSEAIDGEALLASALGIGVEELAAARVEAQELALAQAVQDGRITQEQADAMKARRALADYLGQQGLQDRVRALYEQAVQEAVQAGVITQEQADAILSNGGLPGLRGLDGRPGRGGHWGTKGMRGMPGMEGFSAPGQAAPSRYLRPGVGSGGVSL